MIRRLPRLSARVASPIQKRNNSSAIASRSVQTDFTVSTSGWIRRAKSEGDLPSSSADYAPRVADSLFETDSTIEFNEKIQACLALSTLGANN